MECKCVRSLTTKSEFLAKRNMVDIYFVQSSFKHYAFRVLQILIRLSALSDILKF